MATGPRDRLLARLHSVIAVSAVVSLTAAVGAISVEATAAAAASGLTAGPTPQHCVYHGDQQAMRFNNTVVVKRLTCRTANRAINEGHFSHGAFKFRTHGFTCTASGHSGGVAHTCRRNDAPGRFYFDTSP